MKFLLYEIIPLAGFNLATGRFWPAGRMFDTSDLDDLSNELNNIKAGYSTGEVLLNHLMFADDICVFCPSVRLLQRIPDVCQAYAESHEYIFNCNKTVCMTFKAECKKHSHSIIEIRWSKRKIC